MAHTTPVVVDNVLRASDDRSLEIQVGSPAWYGWLESATLFSFTCVQGSFTARKERSRGNGWYWKAYCMRAGTLHRAYLGKSAALTPERLTEVAASLAAGRPVVQEATSERVQRGAGIDTIPPELLATKLYRPVPRPGLVLRAALV